MSLPASSVYLLRVRFGWEVSQSVCFSCLQAGTQHSCSILLFHLSTEAEETEVHSQSWTSCREMFFLSHFRSCQNLSLCHKTFKDKWLQEPLFRFFFFSVSVSVTEHDIFFPRVLSFFFPPGFCHFTSPRICSPLHRSVNLSIYSATSVISLVT